MKKFIYLDLICYLALPYFIWNYGREPFGDYYAMLLSTIPGFLYTIYRFIREHQFNIAGLFILLSLFLGTVVNLLSYDAESMLWNQIYLGYAYGIIFMISIMIKKPLALRFAVDFVYLQGVARKDSQKLFSEKNIFNWFQLLTGLFFFNSIFQNSLKSWLLHLYGLDGYGEMLIYMNISGLIFNGLIIAGFIFIGSKVSFQSPESNNGASSLLSQEHLQSEMDDNSSSK
ncbi:Integral membrane protein [Planococcus antarcticus DSM 14505]|uniref:Integral membrane protein n=1 Tax=Planococcus antarcticus DSM 14505 TaxID=1185653 RepID=A0AA87IPL5_9BACL|nr:VC0807 family protein [Planococcus antarcticus]EIM08424.1 Integral membrane protein [Planococcus antarcticus DSM 14505]